MDLAEQRILRGQARGRRRARGRIGAAAQLTGLDRLALGTQCGFATSVVGNSLTEEQQRAKLELIAEVAARVWG